jgi:hypothetical protein
MYQGTDSLCVSDSSEIQTSPTGLSAAVPWQGLSRYERPVASCQRTLMLYRDFHKFRENEALRGCFMKC